MMDRPAIRAEGGILIKTSRTCRFEGNKSVCMCVYVCICVCEYLLCMYIRMCVCVCVYMCV